MISVGKMLSGVLIFSFVGLAFFASRSNASTRRNTLNTPAPTPTSTSDRVEPFVSDPVTPGVSPRVDSLPTAEPQTDGPIREINPRQHPNQKTDRSNHGTNIGSSSEVQVSDPVTPSLSSPVNTLPTAEPPEDGTIEEINPRQNPLDDQSKSPSLMEIIRIVSEEKKAKEKE